jgi:LmbE family N-acetylglucosaminyl deacetylase
MLPLTFGVPARAPLTVLCLGAHPDDIEIGCAGTLLRLLSERRHVRVYWIVMSGDATRSREAQRSARRVLRRATARCIRVERFRDGFLPYAGTAVKEVFEQLKGEVSPDLIFTHYRDDCHQDHRLVSELTWNTFRDHSILEYEVPKYDGDLGHPNVFVPLSEGIRRRKIRLLMSTFPSQAGKRWYSPATFDALMRLRGIECGAPEGYAEAFHARKVVLAPGAGRR